MRRIFFILSVLILFSLYDALIGGGIAAVLQRDGWNQYVNTVYQLGFALSIAAVLVFLLHLRKKREVVALGILLIGFVEDTLFYVLVPVVNPLISFITGGATYTPVDGGMLPEYISGWLGWIGRVLGEGNISVSVNVLFITNVVALVLAVLVLTHRKKR